MTFADIVSPKGTRVPFSVVVVDDNVRVRDILCELIELEPELALAATAEDGADAVRIVQEECPDAVICDQQMPRMTGLQAISPLRDACPRAVIVLYTSDPGVGEEALRRGADALFDKTEDPISVLEHLIQLCRERHELG